MCIPWQEFVGLGLKETILVIRSAGKAGYKAIAQDVTEILWLKSLFSKLGYPCVRLQLYGMKT